MNCSRKNQITHAKLLNVPKPLEVRAIDKRLDPVIFFVGELH
jgi:hypothetical protein